MPQKTSQKEQKYEHVLVGVDPVIFTISGKKLNVLLHKREKAPFEGKYELPGGLLLENEKAEQTIARKLKELLGEAKIFFTQFHTFTKPDRDPRQRIISIGYIALISDDKLPKTDSWFETTSLPPLAFDHREIIDKACAYLKENLNHLIVKQFLPHYFPLNKLQDVYEIIEEKKYDNRNFRKKIINEGVVVESDKKQEGCSHRPGKLYMFKL